MPAVPSIIEFRKVNKWFGPLHVLADIDLTVNAGEVVVVCGPSGSGKSTLIRCINRLETIQSGDIVVDGVSLADPKLDAIGVEVIEESACLVLLDIETRQLHEAP